MKIGIVGVGNVGGGVGSGLSRKGHTVTFGLRPGREDKGRELLARSGPGAKTSSVAATAKENDILLLATPWQVTEQALSDCGDVSGKILIDATNPVLPDLSGLTTGAGSSGGQMVAQWAAGAKVVKTFNSVGAQVMADPALGPGKVAMLYCGDDAAAKAIVAGLIDELGFESIDFGPLARAGSLEHLALIWITLAYPCGFGHDFAFQVVRRGKH